VISGNQRTVVTLPEFYALATIELTFEKGDEPVRELGAGPFDVPSSGSSWAAAIAALRLVCETADDEVKRPKEH